MVSTESNQNSAVPFVHLGGGYPALSRDVRRNLRQARRRIAEDGVMLAIRYDTGPALAGLRDEITVAWIARNQSADPPRACDLAWWGVAWGRADEVATLRLDGHLAAWLLAACDPPAYRVLAGQMVPGRERYRPGRLLEADMLRHALAAGYSCADWGSSLHPEALIAVS